MEEWKKPVLKKLYDKKTGREIITKPPHLGFKWKENYVLRSVPSDQSIKATHEGGAIIGDQSFEWVAKDKVEISD